MKLKKANALVALFSTLAMIIHIGYNIFAYSTMYYNPLLKVLTSLPFIAAVCIHAVLGMCAVFFLRDGTRLDLYPRQNKMTIIQRLSAALIFPFLLIHLKTFGLLQSLSEKRNWAGVALVILIQVLFYAIVIAHAAVSFPRALITLGMLHSRKGLKMVEKTGCILGCILFVAAVFAVVRGDLIMFVLGRV